VERVSGALKARGIYVSFEMANVQSNPFLQTLRMRLVPLRGPITRRIVFYFMSRLL